VGLLVLALVGLFVPLVAVSLLLLSVEAPLSIAVVAGGSPPGALEVAPVEEEDEEAPVVAPPVVAPPVVV